MAVVSGARRDEREYSLGVVIDCAPRLVAGVRRVAADLLSRGPCVIGGGYPRADILLAHVGEHQGDLHSQGAAAVAHCQHQRVFVARAEYLRPGEPVLGGQEVESASCLGREGFRAYVHKLRLLPGQHPARGLDQATAAARCTPRGWVCGIQEIPSCRGADDRLGGWCSRPVAIRAPRRPGGTGCSWTRRTR